MRMYNEDEGLWTFEDILFELLELGEDSCSDKYGDTFTDVECDCCDEGDNLSLELDTLIDIYTEIMSDVAPCKSCMHDVLMDFAGDLLRLI